MRTYNTPEVNKRYYEKNKATQIERVKLYKLKVRQYVRDWKEAGPCTDCKVPYPYYKMDADHLFDKKFEVNKGYKHGMVLIKKELEKCERVCSNCHRGRTYNRMRSSAARAILS